MAKLPLYAAGITATFAILLIAAAAEDAALLKQAQGIFQPLPKDMATAEFPITRERVELVRSLFFDPRLTIDASMSCSSCHQPAFYGTDALPKPTGVKQRAHPRHTPTNLRDQVRDKLAISFEDMGEQQVKNIARPVRVYQVRPQSPLPNRPLLAGEESARSAPRRRRWRIRRGARRRWSSRYGRDVP